MHRPFAVTVEELGTIVVQGRSWLALLRGLHTTGHTSITDADLTRWRLQLATIEAARGILRVQVPYEPEIRLMVPELGPSGGGLRDPSMWLSQGN